MRILFLSQLLPLPLDAGPKVRSYYVLRHLAGAGHDVTALCFVRPTDTRASIEAVGRYCRAVDTVPIDRSRLRDVRDAVASAMSPTPFLIRRDRQPRMFERVRTLSRRGFDAVHADQLWMAPYAEACRDVPLKVLDQHNAVFRVPQRLAAGQSNPLVRALLRQEARKLARFEQRTIDDVDRVVWVSQSDRDAFPRRRQPDAAGREPIIPIALDPGSRPPIRREAPHRVTFVGGLHWPPNAEGVRWFLRECWPSIAKAVPRAVFTVVGQPAARALGGARVLPERVQVTGYVGDLRQLMAETAASVVPLKTGAGMRVKILDAWCWGLPVISTTIGAEGLRATAGEHLIIADEPQALADSVIRVMTDAPLARRLADAGRAFVETEYDWRRVYQAWNRVYVS